MSALVRWLDRHVPKREILDRDEQSLYLTRYFLAGNRDRSGSEDRSGSPWALMLHRMHRPDNDACHHDHPWSFFTLILRGGYVEEVTRRDGTVKVRRNRPGMILFRRAEHTHRIDRLPAGEAWTLVLRFKRRRSWGFHTGEGWVPWRTFLDLRGAVAWCVDRLPGRGP